MTGNDVDGGSVVGGRGITGIDATGVIGTDATGMELSTSLLLLLPPKKSYSPTLVTSCKI